MIKEYTKLNVSDNSGAREVICIRIMYTKKKTASIGNIIKVSIKRCAKKSKVKKGKIYNALIVNTKYQKKGNNYYYKFKKNSVVILDNRLEIIGTRIFGVIPRLFKNSIFKRITSISKFLI